MNKPTYQLKEEIKSLSYEVRFLNEERDILWQIIGCLVGRDHPTYIKLRTKIAMLDIKIYDRKVALTSGSKGKKIHKQMVSLGFVETKKGAMHYALKDCDRKFRVRGGHDVVGVEKSVPPEKFDRWAISIESVYYLTPESGQDLLDWALSYD